VSSSGAQWYDALQHFATSPREVENFFCDSDRLFNCSTQLIRHIALKRTGMKRHRQLDSLSLEELRALEERVARGETTFDEEMALIVANGCRPDEAAFEAALERALCRGEDPPPSLDDLDDGEG
jgi:hypothetical protein